MLICLNDLFACLGLTQTRKLLTNFSKNSFYLLPEPLRRGKFLTNYCLMEKQDIYESLIGLLFPSEITEHFKIVHIESLPQVMVVHFEEKDEFHDKEGGHEYVPNGFYESSRINDFPIRDKKVTLVVKRRRWIDKSTGKSVGNKYELTAEGTRHSKEFAAFLKGIFGQLPDSGTES